MPASPIRKLTPYADQAKKKGKHVYHLNIGQPDIETPRVMLDAIRHIDFTVWAYTPSEGTARYREKLSGYYNRLGYGITSDDILVTNGGSEALSIALLACADVGDEVIIPEPFYANYNGFAHSGGIVIRPILATIDDGFALPSVPAFEALISERTKAILICNPNNPTGYLYSRPELQALLDLCRRYNLFLLVDEAYREFCYDGREFVSPLHFNESAEHVIVLDTVSKRYSACGARLGCLITKNQDIKAAALKFAQARLSPPAVAQLAATAAIDTPNEYFEAVKREYTARRDTLVSGLNGIPGVYCPNPGGAFYVVARLPIDDADRFCQWMLEHFSHENKTVMMAPASGFYSTPNTGKNEVRMAYVLNVNDLNEALTCIRLGLAAYPGRTF